MSERDDGRAQARQDSEWQEVVKTLPHNDVT